MSMSIGLSLSLGIGSRLLGSGGDIEGLRYAATPNGRTSNAALKVPGFDALPAGVTYNAGTKLVTINGLVAEISDWDFRECQVLVKAGATVVSYTQNLGGETTAHGYTYYLKVEAGGKITRLSYCTWEGPYNWFGAGVAIDAEVSGTAGSPTIGDIEKISYCRFLGLTSDCIKALGSNHPQGQRIEWCYFGAPVNVPQYAPATWSAGTSYSTGDYVVDLSRNIRGMLSLVDSNLNNLVPTGTTSDANWQVLDPHSDGIQMVAAKNGIAIRNCLFDWVSDPVGAFGPYYQQGLNNSVLFARNAGTDWIIEGQLLFENCHSNNDSALSYPTQVWNNGLGNWSATVIYRNSTLGANGSGASFNPSTTDADCNYWIGMTRSDTGAAIAAPASASTTDIAATPVNTIIPSISGTFEAGATITAVRGTYTGFPRPFVDVTIQRSADGLTGWADVVEAATYTLTVDDVGYYFRAKDTTENSSGEIITYSNASIAVVAGYTQNLVNNNATAYLNVTPGGTATKVEFSVWVNPVSFTVPAAPRLVRSSQGIDLQFASGGVIVWDVYNSAGTRIFLGQTAAGAITTGVKHHVYVNYDAVAGTRELRVDGVAVTLVPSVGPNTGDVRPNRPTALLAGGTTAGNYSQVSDLYLNFHSGTMLGYAAFWNGGTPPNPNTLGTPHVLLGGPMRANDDTFGNAAHGWNDAYNYYGSSTVTAGSATFT